MTICDWMNYIFFRHVAPSNLSLNFHLLQMPPRESTTYMHLKHLKRLGLEHLVDVNNWSTFSFHSLSFFFFGKHSRPPFLSGWFISCLFLNLNEAMLCLPFDMITWSSSTLMTESFNFGSFELFNFYNFNGLLHWWLKRDEFWLLWSLLSDLRVNNLLT